MATLDLAGIITRVCTDLKLRFAAIIHNHSASDITSGTLPLERGGTGKSASSAYNLLNSLFFDATEDDGALYLNDSSDLQVGTLPINRGGTGATGASVARSNLGAQETLVSGTNIKTINNESLLGSGNINISGGGSTTTWYGTCSTTASTAAKVVTCENFSLVKGAIIAILFTTANTAATPTLNVNSTGAKSIYIGSDTVNSTTNTLKWSANTLLYFMYDGTYFRYLSARASAAVVPPDGAGVWYGTSDTTGETSAKASTITNFRLVKGAIVSVTFINGNTVIGALTLNINSTGAKAIYVNNDATSATNKLSWDAGETLTFIYSGTYWHLISKFLVVNPGERPTPPDTTGSLSVAQSTNTNITSISPGTGVWLISGRARFAASTAGIRVLKLSTVSNDIDTPHAVNAVPFGAVQYLQVVGCFELSASDTVYLIAYHSNGSALNISLGQIEATRIG